MARLANLQVMDLTGNPLGGTLDGSGRTFAAVWHGSGGGDGEGEGEGGSRVSGSGRVSTSGSSTPGGRGGASAGAELKKKRATSAVMAYLLEHASEADRHAAEAGISRRRRGEAARRLASAVAAVDAPAIAEAGRCRLTPCYPRLLSALEIKI
jgi:hypothetical protein